MHLRPGYIGGLGCQLALPDDAAKAPTDISDHQSSPVAGAWLKLRPVAGAWLKLCRGTSAGALTGQLLTKYSRIYA